MTTEKYGGRNPPIEAVPCVLCGRPSQRHWVFGSCCGVCEPILSRKFYEDRARKFYDASAKLTMERVGAEMFADMMISANLARRKGEK